MYYIVHCQYRGEKGRMLILSVCLALLLPAGFVFRLGVVVLVFLALMARWSQRPLLQRGKLFSSSSSSGKAIGKKLKTTRKAGVDRSGAGKWHSVAWQPRHPVASGS